MIEGRRERKKLETQQALRVAALHLADVHGLEHTTVEMIAAEADVSPRTFFNHFPTKEDALLGPGAHARADVERFWAERADEPPLATLRAMLLLRAETFADRSDEMVVRRRVLAANPALYARFHASFEETERVVREAVARRTGLDPDRDLYPAVLAATGGAVMRVSMSLWHAGGRRRLSDIVSEAFDLYATGLEDAPPPRRAPTRRRPSPRP